MVKVILSRRALKLYFGSIVYMDKTIHGRRNRYQARKMKKKKEKKKVLYGGISTGVKVSSVHHQVQVLAC